MHIYKQDPTLYFCGYCLTTRPLRDVKRDVVVVPPSEAKTFMQQVKSRKPLKKETATQKMLREAGFNITDYQETSDRV